jgi:hypothetical protein
MCAFGQIIERFICFFHVQKNVKEYLKNKDEKIKAEIVKDLNFMHFCRNVVEFTVAKSSIYKKWDENGLSEFRAYFEKQWIQNDKFSKWVILVFFCK